MSGLTRSRALSAALLLGLFVAGVAIGYVYKHDPQPEVVSVRVAPPTPPTGPRVISGTVTSLDGGKLTLTTEGGPVTVALPPGLPVDQLVRATSGLPAGTAVNVGVESGQYGLTLTGIVAVEGAR